MKVYPLTQCAETIKTCFDPPAGMAPYDYVVDFTGEVLHNRTEEVQRVLDVSSLFNHSYC